ncbi:type I glyceraldehyde-3-phosphate dehydrogenase [Salinisphaera sp. Q1T1-3]|uniref:type I glyceraldehyde-3-phosphate dehydrogenase n=1 Tax=Salinisphaera sp. Q1T1-3 TaxID=2321229 RepID=UPI000E71C883|nr:type I glyceraldehyde-3-phosphate dehydrogenase [Salinisphaera sp. Q1T1-3]RJS94362.1 type I glyceraldehyde-3-phosphate dehydrogenase [Salinisphaera sp. Q1T1-3]
MAVKIGINGYGRIGRNVLRALYEAGRTNELEIVAINDLGDANMNAHLTQYDTAHGKFPGEVKAEGEDLVVNGDKIKVLSERNPADLPWGDLGVEVVLECTGLFASEEKASAHLKGGAKKVLVSAPAGDMKTIVYGVNHETLTADDKIVSNASCTTNCLAPLVKPLHEAFGIEYGLMNTIHSYTNDQVLSDVYHKDIRRARSATQSMIPTKTGAAAAVGMVLPDLDGKLDGFAVRVPTINVSFVDLSATVRQDVTIEQVNEVLKNAANGELKGVLAYTDEELVSQDYNHNPVSSTVDSKLTKVAGGRLIKVCSWYDNEWGFSNRMLDTALAMAKAG